MMSHINGFGYIIHNILRKLLNFIFYRVVHFQAILNVKTIGTEVHWRTNKLDLLRYESIFFCLQLSLHNRAVKSEYFL